MCSGADLGVIIRRVFADGAHAGVGAAALLRPLPRRGPAACGDPGFDPAAMRDREALATDNFAQAVCRIGGRLAEALAFAHAHGVLHCDIKQANILLTPNGRPMLADFNVAFDRTRHTPEGHAVRRNAGVHGPEYHAVMLGRPGGSADERCDIFSLGVVLYELATGTRPRKRLPTQTAETVLPAATNLNSPLRAWDAGRQRGERGTATPLARVRAPQNCWPR